MNCKYCDVELNPDNTYRRSGRKPVFPVGYYRYCKTCYNKDRMKRINTNKKLQLEHLGGKCVICGYNKCPDALDFHHLNPSTKEKQPARMKSVTNSDEWKTELEKCVILCANCHRETHAGLHPEYIEEH